MILSGLTTVVSYSLTIFLTYTIAPDEYGVYLLAIAWAGIFGIIIDFSTSAVYSHLREEASNARDTFSTVFSVRLIGLALCLITILLTDFIVNKIPVQTLYFIWGSLNLGFLFEYERKNVVYALIVLLEKSVFVLSTMFFIYYFSSVDLIFIAYLTTTIISLGVQFVIFRQYIAGFKLKGLFQLTHYVRKYFPFFIITLVQLGYGSFSRLVFESKLGNEIFVYFSLAIQLISLSSVFQGQADRIFRPEIIKNIQRNDVVGLRKLTINYFVFYIFPMTVLAFVMSFLSPYFIKILFSDEYFAVSYYFRNLTLLFVTIPIIRLVDHFLLALDKFNINLWLNISITVLLIFSLIVVELDEPYYYAYIIVLFQILHAISGFVLIKNHRRFK